MIKEDLGTVLEEIEEGSKDFSEDERLIIESWIEKLKEPSGDEEVQKNVFQYATALAKLITEKKKLSEPFNESPPDKLPPFSTESNPKKTSDQSRKQSFQIKRMPCNRPRTQTDQPQPKSKKSEINKSSLESLTYNEFEDPKEMAKAIARSKGQTFAEFVASISRHTKDFGQELRTAMKAETCGFRDYVDHVLSQRIKDFTDVLDEEQNQELLRIKKDTEKWQMELSRVKKWIKEIIPSFDIDSYRKDRNFLKKHFTNGSPGLPQDDSLKRWREENCHRLRSLVEMTDRISHCNERLCQEISDLERETLKLETKESTKKKNNIKLIKNELAEYQKLKEERDQLLKENARLLAESQENGH